MYRLPRQEWLLGGAAIVVLAGVATALLQRRQMPAARALPATSTLAETNDIVVASSESSSQSLSSPPTSPKPSYWWELREIFIVADQGDGQNPATAGPILFQAAGRAIMPAFQVHLSRFRLLAQPALPPSCLTGLNHCRTKPRPRYLQHRSRDGIEKATAHLVTEQQITRVISTW